MKTSIKILVIACFCFFAASCNSDRFSQVVDVELPEHEPRLAISADYRPNNDAILITVFESQSILSQNQSAAVEEAVIELNAGGTSLIGTLIEDTGFYFGEIESHAEPGDEVELRVSADGFETVVAKQLIPDRPLINEIAYTEDGTVDLYGEQVDLLEVTIPDNPNEENYYILRVFKTEYTSFGTYSYSTYLETPDFTVDQIDGGLGFTDQSFIDNELTISSSIYNYMDESLDSVNLVVELENVTRDKYLFKKSLQAYYNSQGPFAEPADVHENIQNGYGIFTASNAARDSIRIF